MMNSRHAMAFVVALLPLLAGCDGASSARELSETSRAVEAKSASVEAPSGNAATASSPGSQSPGAELALPPRDSSGVRDASFDDIKFPMEKTDLFQRSMLTPKVEALSGEKMRIRGYIYPTLRKRGLKEFVLVRDNLECCFGPGAALFDCIVVRMAAGKTTEYSPGMVAVEGEFRIAELPGPDGRPMAIYQMTADAVK